MRGARASEPGPAVADPGRETLERGLVPLALAGLVACVYWGIGGHEFVAYDDGLFVTENAVVQRGLTLDGVRWALTTLHSANWHPVTWISHMLDVQLFGLDAGWHHRVNVLFHAANALLLFGWLRAATGSTWRSAFAGAFFAVHPLRVESVAWVAERRDVLSALFWLLALWAYLAYARRPARGRYLLVVLALALGLGSKAMVVTLPAVLLLLDVWPLRRLPPDGLSWRSLRPLLVEKVPLVALSLAASAVAVLGQARDALVEVERLPLGSRAANAVLSTGRYLARAIWPADLAVLYPHPAWQPGGIPAAEVAGWALALAAVTGIAAWQWRRRPFLAVGWLWTLVALLPVSGLVQVGIQGMADRYTYLPLVGATIAGVWAFPAEAFRSARARAALAAAAAALLGTLAVAARAQAARWRDTVTLFEHAAAVTSGNWQAWEILGGEYLRLGRPADAMEAFRRALAASPRDAAAWRNIAAMQARAGDHAAAARTLEAALRVAPGDLETWYALGVAYAWLERPLEIAGLVERLRGIDPAKADQLAERFRRPPAP